MTHIPSQPQLKPLKDNILFQWIDDFEQETTLASGIVLQRSLNKERNRWGQIIAVGPLSQAKVGEYILPADHVEAYGAHCEDVKEQIWRVRDENVLLLSTDYNHTEPLNDTRSHTDLKKWTDL